MGSSWKSRSRAVLAAAMLLLSVSFARTAFAADPAASEVTGEVTVFAAASLRDAFTELAATFAARHPGAKITFNFAGSPQLAAHILEKAPADVFASANNEQMRRVSDGGRVEGTPQTFAANVLEIAVERGNPENITGLADLARADIIVVMAAPEVPAGKYATEALQKAGVTVNPASLELDVRAVLAKVTMGEADAGIVYHTDVVAAGDKVEGIAIPPPHNVRATYPIAALKDAPNAAGGAAFLALVLSDEGQAVLARHGFATPRTLPAATPK